MPRSWSRRAVITAGAGLALGASLRPAEAQPAPLRKGMNIHHMLNWPELDSAQATPSYIWPPFQSDGYRTSDAEFQRLRAAGIDFLRVTVDPAIYLLQEGERQAEVDRILIDTVTRMLDLGFQVVVDLHPVGNVPDYGPDAFIVSPESAASRAYGDMLARLARLLGPLPQGRVLFELMNEPQLTREEDHALWQSLLAYYHERARSGASELPLVLTGQHWSSASALQRIDLSPFRGSNILVTFHYYDPHAFTHQGVVGQHAQYLTGLRWPPRPEQFQDLTALAEKRIAEDATLDDPGREKALMKACETLTDYFNQGHGPSQVARDFERVRAWARRWNILPGRVLLGEFGAVRLTEPEVNQDRLAWLSCIRSASEQHKFPWALWVYRGYGGMALADDSPARAIDPDMLTALQL